MPIDNSCYTTEKGLIEACVKQDRLAQKMIYEQYSPRMYSVCVRYAKDRDSAKDILQDGFITVFSKIESYNGNGSFEGWMRKIFVNTALMLLRKGDVLKECKDIADLRGDSPIIDNIIERIDGKEIFKLISEMPQGFRTVFNMSVIDGYSHQEISKALNISEGASRSQLSRGRLWLQERILNMDKKR